MDGAFLFGGGCKDADETLTALAAASAFTRANIACEYGGAGLTIPVLRLGPVVITTGERDRAVGGPLAFGTPVFGIAFATPGGGGASPVESKREKAFGDGSGGLGGGATARALGFGGGGTTVRPMGGGAGGSTPNC